MSPIAELIVLEWRLTVRNRQVLPLLLCFPLIGFALPSAMLWLGSEVLLATQRGELPLLAPLLSMVQTFAQIAAIDLHEAVRTMVLRSTAAYYILVPTLILPITATFAVVGERQRRTLEPLLATPMTDLQFCLGKLCATVLPALVASWTAALGGALLAAGIVHAHHGLALWPDAIWLAAVLVLTPVLAIFVALTCLWISVRARDAQAATQTCAVVMMPVIVLVLTVLGPRMVIDGSALMWTLLAVLVLDALLVWVVCRVFRRVGLLGAA